MVDIIQQYLVSWRINSWISEALAYFILILGVVLLCFIANWIAKKIILKAIRFAIKKTKTQWDNHLVKNKFFHRLSNLIPAFVIYFSASLFPDEATIAIHKVATIFMMFVSVMVLDSFLNTIGSIYRTLKVSREKPIKGYIQLVKIFIYIAGAIFIISIAIDKSPWGLLSGLGAMTAIIMLVFKDSILGFVASIQMSAYDMVRKGDWITMPKFGVDGNVIDVSLNVVKIQNFDNTIITLPSYMLIQDSVQNWRGMTESGGRRIKRSVHIDLNSIKFCDENMLKRFETFDVIHEYIQTKTAEIEAYNKEKNIDTLQWINGRRLTNIGCFRAYVVEYLKRHPKIHKQGMTFLIRQLEPTANGLPIQLYVFTNDTDWVNYEGIQADIFDHILAIVKEFDLHVFQNPTGSDFKDYASHKFLGTESSSDSPVKQVAYKRQ